MFIAFVSLHWAIYACSDKHHMQFEIAKVSIYIHYRVWDGIPHPFHNFTSPAVEFWELINNLTSHFTGYAITYPCYSFS